MRFWFVFSLHSELSEDQVWFSLRMPAVNSWSNCKSHRNLDLLRMSLSSGPKSAGFLAKSTLRLTYSLLCGIEKWLQWCPGFVIEILGTQRFLEHIWNDWKIILHLEKAPWTQINLLQLQGIWPKGEDHGELGLSPTSVRFVASFYDDDIFFNSVLISWL